MSAELIAISNQKLEMAQLQQEQDKLENAITSPQLAKTVLDHDLKENRELIKLQKRTIEELKVNLHSLTVQKEVGDLKASTLNLVASKNNKELTQLKKDVHFYEVSLEEQQLQMKNLQDAIESASKQIASKKTEFESFKKELWLKKQRTVQDKNELKNITSEITDYNDKIERIKSDLENESRNLAHLEKELETLKTEYDSRSNELETLFVQLLSRQKRHESLKSQKEQLQKNIAKNKLEISSTENEIDHWQKNIEQFDHEIATLNASYERKNLEYSNLRETLSRCMIESDQKRITFEEETIRERELTANVVAAKDKSDRLRQELNKKNNELFELRRNIEQKKTQVAILEEENASYSQKIITLDNDINKFEAVHAGLSATHRNLKTTVSDLQSNCSAMADNLHSKEKMIADTRMEIESVELEIEKLRATLASYNNSIIAQAATLSDLNDRNRQLHAHRDERICDVKEKESIINQQREHIFELDAMLKQTQHEYELIQEKSKELHLKLEENKRFLDDLNKNLNDSENCLTHTRDRMTASIKELRESDTLIFESLQGLELQRLSYEMIERDVKEKLRLASSHKESRDKELALYQENLVRLQSELQRRLNHSDSLKCEMEQSKADMSAVRAQIESISERIATTGTRNTELKSALDGQELTYLQLCATRDDLAKDLELKTGFMNQTLSKIAEKDHVTNLLQAEINTLAKREMELRQRLEVETVRLEKLQNEESSQRTTISNQRSSIFALNENIEEIQVSNADYGKKVEAQNRAMEENAAVLEALTKRNRSLIEQLAKYEDIFNRNLQALDAQKEAVVGLNNLANERQATFDGHNKKLYANVDQVSPAALAEMASLERAIEVTPMDQMMALKRSLESRYFNLTVSIDENIALMHELIDADAVQVATHMHTSVLKALETCFSSEAEVLLDIRGNNQGMNTTMTVSSVKDMPGHQAKEVLIPMAKQLMSRFSAYKAQVNYRIKLNSSGNIEKLVAEIKVSVPQAHSDVEKAS